MAERIWTWIAWHLPRSLVYWCAIRLGVAATGGQYGNTVVSELTVGEALKRWRMPV